MAWIGRRREREAGAGSSWVEIPGSAMGSSALLAGDGLGADARWGASGIVGARQPKSGMGANGMIKVALLKDSLITRIAWRGG